MDSVHGTVDYHVVHDRLVDPLKGRSPEGPEAFDVFGEAILRPERFLERNGLDEADVLVFNSGEHLFSGGEAREDFVLAGRLALLLAGAAVGRKVICLPSTFGPFHSDFSSALARMFVKSCAAISVRESASLNSLHEIGIDPGLHNIPALLDPAFFLDVPEIRQAESDDPNLISVGIRLDGFGLRVGGQASSKALRSSAGRSSEIPRPSSSTRISAARFLSAQNNVSNVSSKRLGIWRLHKRWSMLSLRETPLRSGASRSRSHLTCKSS